MNAPKNNTGAVIRFLFWIVFVVALAVVIYVRLRLLSFPLERDEGEYAYAGQLLLRGIPPYQLAYNLKFPGSYFVYALFLKLFGESIPAVHIGLLIVNLATIAVLFFLGRRLRSSLAGIIAASTFAFLSLSPAVAGYAAHATHFVVIAALGGMLLLLSALSLASRWRLFVSGVLFGIAVLMKQPGIWFPIGAALYLVCEQKINRKHRGLPVIRELLVLAAGTLLPLVITGLYLWRAGAFGRFWFWTIQYAREHGSLLSATQALAVFRHQIQSVVGVNWPLWGIAALGLCLCIWRVEWRGRLPFLLVFSGAAVLAVCTGFYFREHYFILVLPAVSLFAAVAVTTFVERTKHVIPIFTLLLFGAALAYPIFRARDVLFRLTPIDACRAIYYPNPFAESLSIAEFVRKRTDPADQIAVLGSEPQICFYANRRSATGYIHTYGLMEPLPHASRMQREMIAEIERARPKLIILVAINESWIPQPNCDRTIFQWANDYCRDNYTPVGVVRFPEEGEGAVFDFSTDPSLRDLVRDYILIYERKI